jgi:8-amino-7-oxononanoate synthase
MQKFAYYEQQLEMFASEGLLRQCRCIDSAQGPTVRMSDGSEKVLFCSNNYLNLANDPRVKRAAVEAIEKYGFGAAAARLVSGTMPPHVELEKAFAAFLHKEAALYLPSGWAANQALLSTLPQKGDLVMIDRMDHASIIDAVKGCQAEFRTYRRDRLDRLEKYLAQAQARRFIVTESVFSMDGDRAHLKELAALRNRYDAILIVDEAHSFGCFGPTGAGLSETEGILHDVDIFVAPLGKAVGAAGGVIAGPTSVIRYLVNRARAFIYTTAAPPVIAAGAIKALDIIQAEPDRRQRLTEKADFLRNAFAEMGLDTGASTSQIIPVILGDSARAVDVSRRLFDAGYLISAIRPPTVPPGTARLRVSVQSDHTPEQLQGLVRAIGVAAAG